MILAMETIAEGIYHLDELVGGPTLLVAPDRVTLVDTGLPGSEEAILAAITSLGRRPEDLKVVLITHPDPDHVGALGALVEATGAKVYAGENEADVVEGKAPNRAGDTYAGVPVERRLPDGETLPLHGGIRVVATFGHTLGHVSYYLPREGLLIAGDCVNNVEGLAGSMPQYTADAEQAREAVRRIAELRPGTICFGHGPSIVGNAAAQLEELAARI
jgi:glyoxylase-like metal-dependent hydrolase (beta-lactamase superfamily II)